MTPWTRIVLQNAQWWFCEKLPDVVTRGVLSVCTAGARMLKAGQAGVPTNGPSLGLASLAKSVQYDFMVPASWVSALLRRDGTPLRLVKRNWSSSVCVAPYGKLTGGRNSIGALASVNSYAKVGTCSDRSSSVTNAVHENVPSVRTAASAWSGLLKFLSGYSFRISLVRVLIVLASDGVPSMAASPSTIVLAP